MSVQINRFERQLKVIFECLGLSNCHLVKTMTIRSQIMYANAIYCKSCLNSSSRSFLTWLNFEPNDKKPNEKKSIHRDQRKKKSWREKKYNHFVVMRQLVDFLNFHVNFVYLSFSPNLRDAQLWFNCTTVKLCFKKKLPSSSINSRKKEYTFFGVFFLALCSIIGAQVNDIRSRICLLSDLLWHLNMEMDWKPPRPNTSNNFPNWKTL